MFLWWPNISFWTMSFQSDQFWKALQKKNSSSIHDVWIFDQCVPTVSIWDMKLAWIGLQLRLIISLHWIQDSNTCTCTLPVWEREKFESRHTVWTVADPGAPLLFSGSLKQKGENSRRNKEKRKGRDGKIEEERKRWERETKIEM